MEKQSSASPDQPHFKAKPGSVFKAKPGSVLPKQDRELIKTKVFKAIAFALCGSATSSAPADISRQNLPDGKPVGPMNKVSPSK